MVNKFYEEGICVASLKSTSEQDVPAFIELMYSGKNLTTAVYLHSTKENEGETSVESYETERCKDKEETIRIIKKGGILIRTPKLGQ